MDGLQRMPPNGESLVAGGREKQGFLWLGARQAMPSGAMLMRGSWDAPILMRESHESVSLATAVSLWPTVGAIHFCSEASAPVKAKAMMQPFPTLTWTRVQPQRNRRALVVRG